LHCRYSLSAPGTESADNSFVVDPSSGVVRTAKVLDRESVPFYHLTVYAVDRGSPALSATVSIPILHKIIRIKFLKLNLIFESNLSSVSSKKKTLPYRLLCQYE